MASTRSTHTDDFHVRFLVDSSGLPGAEVAPQETNVPSSRVDTGVNFSSYDQYIFTLTLVSPVTLNSGTNWVEISNDVTNSADTFCWMEGLPDPTNGVPGFAFAFEDPGVTWFSRRGDMSLELNGVVVPIELESFSIDK